MQKSADIIIGVDAGTSVMKAVAFTLSGVQLATSSIKNKYTLHSDGAATQSMKTTWSDCTKAIVGLHNKIDDLDKRVAAIAVTGQGDGTWLMDKERQPVHDAWLWLDARAAPTVSELSKSSRERVRFEATGTGLNTCQQGTQLAHMQLFYPELLEKASHALHCKDWLYYCLTGVIATDPSEASFTFGDFRTREYNDHVIDALGLSAYRYLLPDIIDGTKTFHGLSSEAAKICNLKAGTPVCLGFVDMIMTGLGAGVYTNSSGVACSTIGSTGVHMKAVSSGDVLLGAEHTGYVLCLPCDDIVAQTQTNMAATLNLDWVLEFGAELIGEFGQKPTHQQMLSKLSNWIEQAQPASLLYHPYISDAGERGPFNNAHARAAFNGISSSTDYSSFVRAIVEGLSMAARDCYQAMGKLPTEVRITGGAARSDELRRILAASLKTPVRISARDEAGAAGAAMMAAVAIGSYEDMHSCIETWVSPLLGDAEPIDQVLSEQYEKLFFAYHTCREAMPETWTTLAVASEKQAQTLQSIVTAEQSSSGNGALNE